MSLDVILLIISDWVKYYTPANRNRALLQRRRGIYMYNFSIAKIKRPCDCLKTKYFNWDSHQAIRLIREKHSPRNTISVLRNPAETWFSFYNCSHYCCICGWRYICRGRGIRFETISKQFLWLSSQTDRICLTNRKRCFDNEKCVCIYNVYIMWKTII